MRLLFDANLSPRLIKRLDDLFPESTHVQEIGLTTPDDEVWTYAVSHQLVVVTKDDDFRSKALLVAPPGKVILLTLGNCSTESVEDLFRRETPAIVAFLRTASETLLVIP